MGLCLQHVNVDHDTTWLGSRKLEIMESSNLLCIEAKIEKSRQLPEIETGSEIRSEDRMQQCTLFSNLA